MHTLVKDAKDHPYIKTLYTQNSQTSTNFQIQNHSIYHNIQIFARHLKAQETSYAKPKEADKVTV